MAGNKGGLINEVARGGRTAKEAINWTLGQASNQQLKFIQLLG